jgi:NAD(P)-dependent dehydrogenase (short-subunit alcohol dehydrogenase family)
VKGRPSRRVALVTGAGVRLGRAIALERAAAGCDVAVHYRKSREEAQATASEIRRLGARAVTIRAELAKPAECEGLVSRVLAAFGRLDILVGSAANFIHRSFADTDAATWDDAMNVNARANFLLARAAAAELRRRGGRVVMISDLAAAGLEGLRHMRSRSRARGGHPGARAPARAGGFGQRGGARN